MSNLVIVAIPNEDDYVHKISSQKIPHITLLFLGEVLKVKNLGKILQFVGHAADQSLTRFGLEVDHRGVLGEDQADVLFFAKTKWSGFDTVKDFRSHLLNDNNIRTAYDSAEQFSEWEPHLTLGYPDTPAKSDNREYPGTRYVEFDRIAAWFGEFEGIEYPLKAHSWEWDMAVPMSSTVEAVDDILTHFGAKGMKWGVRKSRPTGPQGVSVTDKKKRIKTKGGGGHSAHPEAVSSRTIGQIGKKSGLKSLSNKQLQEFNNRLNLEQQTKRLQYESSSPPRKFIKSFLKQTGSSSSKEMSNATTALGKKAVMAALV